MKTISRVLKNVPVFVVLMFLLAAAGPVFVQAPTASAAEDISALADLSAGMTPEQIEAGKKMLETSEEARKALAERKKQAEAAKDLRNKGEKKEGEAAKEGQVTKVEPGSAYPAYDWKTSTYVGNLFLKRLADNEARTLIHFGHEIFNPTPGAAPVLENMPVAPGYVIGPGDEIVVKMWGRVEGTQRVVVDRDGKIYLPKFGSLYVAGKTFDELKSFLKAKVSTIAEVRSDVTMGQMKGIRVSAVGEVRAPGWYNVSSLHTALQALSMAGGVKDIGSLRRIRINRGGSEVQEIDLYDYLLKGDTRSDIRLLQGDAVFVPVVGRLVAISGEVRRPAIYELREEKTLLDLVGVAGGFSPSAYKRRVRVERLEGHASKSVLDTDAEQLEKEQRGFGLADGDIVRILPILGPEQNVVALEGNVLRPGKYELKPGMTVGSLFKDAKDFLPETYFDYALLTRLIPPDMRKEAIPVNLRQIVLEGRKEADIPLQPFDNITVFPRSAFRDAPKVTIAGEVRKPGSFDLKKGARVTDLIKVAGDLTRSAYLLRTEIVRIDANRNIQLIYIDLGKAMAEDEKENLLLEDEDQVVIRKIPDGTGKITVALAGEVRFPGTYAVRKGESLSSLLDRAGGFTPDAYLKAAQFTRVSTQKTQQEAIDRLISDLELEIAQKAQAAGGALDKEDVEANKELVSVRRSLIEQLRKAKAKGRVVMRVAEVEKLKGTSADILLEDGDRLEVPKKMNVVNVVGRVYNPTGVVYDPVNDALGYYLQLVGGPTESADRDHIFLLKANGSVVTRDNVSGGFFVFGERGLMSAKVEPGDSIMVPEKLIQTRLMKDVKDITQILYQIAVTAGVLIVAF